MSRYQFLFAALLVLFIGQAALSAIAPGTIQLTRYENGNPIQWKTTGTSAVIHGDDADLFITWDKSSRRWICIVQADEEAAATDGYIPELKVVHAGCMNTVHLEARRVN